MNFLRSLTARSRYIILLVGIAAVYIISGKLGLQLAFVNSSATAVWPPTGIAIASFLLFGYRIWPAILFGAFFVNITTAGTIATSLGIGIGNTLEGFVAAWLVNRFANGRDVFDDPLDVARFALYAGVASTTLSATIGTLTLITGSLAAWHSFWPIWTTWWLGDLAGALIVTPLAVLWYGNYRFGWIRTQWLEATALFALLIATALFVFTDGFPFPYVFMPLLIWVGLRFSQREAATAVLVLATISIGETLHGLGPFRSGRMTPNESLLLLQSFMAIASVTALTVSAAMTQDREKDIAIEWSERRFRALIEHSSDAIVLISKNGIVTYASPSSKRILGYTPEEIMWTDGFKLVHPDDLSRTQDALKTILKKPSKPITLTLRVRKKSGAWAWVRSTGTNLLHEPAVKAIVVNWGALHEGKS